MSMTQEEKSARIAELKHKIAEAEKDVNYYNALQQGFKLILNGIYGAGGNKFYCLYNADVAGAITAMGRNLIQYMLKCNDDYWYTAWHLDTKLHAILGITDVKQIDGSWIHTGSGKDVVGEPDEQCIELGTIVRRCPVSVYCDTDSLMISFKPAIDSCGWDKNDFMNFIFICNEHRLAKYFKVRLEQYAAKFGVENIQDFELERINESIIFMKKKHYVQHVRWEDGIPYKSLDYIYPKGIDIVKGGTPPFAREKVKEIIKYLLSHPEDYNVRDLLVLMKEIKRQYMLADIESISMGTSCSNYDAHVFNDKTDIEVKDGTHFAVRMAAFHNYLLFNNPKCKNKYQYIRSGTPFKYYYCVHDKSKYFAYIRGEYPEEYAPQVDYDTQFEKTVLSQVNDFVMVLGMPEIKKRLTVVYDLFGKNKQQVTSSVAVDEDQWWD